MAKTSKKFNKAVKKIQQDWIDNAAVRFGEVMTKLYKRAIDQFYDDYTPRVYKRTHQTYATGIRGEYPYNEYSAQKVDIKTIDGGNGRRITLTIDSARIPPDTYANKDQDWVFGRTFLEGIHGFTQKDEFTKNIKEHYPKAHIPKKMKTPPAVLLNKWVDRLKKGYKQYGEDVADFPTSQMIKDEALKTAISNFRK